MQQYSWPRMTIRKWGRPLVRATHKYDPAYLAALREFARDESTRLGYRVSMATIHMESALRQNARLRRLYLMHDGRLSSS